MISKNCIHTFMFTIKKERKMFTVHMKKAFYRYNYMYHIAHMYDIGKKSLFIIILVHVC